MDDIRLIPCPSCGGQPEMMIRPGWPHPRLQIVCSQCGRQGPIVYYCPEGDKWFLGVSAYETNLLPGLARARREAAACWNQGNGS